MDLARALSTHLHVLLLDEPTGALGQHEADRLHDLLRRLASEGHGIVYVSHRLRDILAVCTRLVVLRGGHVVLDRPAAGFGIAELSAALVPEVQAIEHVHVDGTPEETVLSVEWTHGQRFHFLRGEIVGLFGMAAGPQFTFLEALYGLGEHVDAELESRRYAPHSPRDAIRRGVYYVSANRERDGLLAHMSALDNLVLPWMRYHTRFLAFSHAKAARIYARAEEALNVETGHMDEPIVALSGGNRQKLVVGRWLFGRKPKVLLLSPTHPGRRCRRPGRHRARVAAVNKRGCDGVGLHPPNPMRSSSCVTAPLFVKALPGRRLSEAPIGASACSRPSSDGWHEGARDHPEYCEMTTMELARKVQFALARNGTLVGLVILIVFFNFANEHFLSLANARNIGEAVSALGVVSIPLALLVICGAVDLSVGSIASLAGIIGALIMRDTGSTLGGAAAGLGVGLAAGTINGILVSYLRLNSIVVTLGALSVWGGLALYVTGGRTVAGLPDAFIDLGLIRLGGIPLEIFILAAAIIYGVLVLERLPYGRRLKAVGGNRRVAFLMGVPVQRVQFLMFVQVGIASALAGLMLSSKLAAATPITGQGLEINALTVVLLGGVAFAGGIGRISGVVAGLFFVGVLA